MSDIIWILIPLFAIAGWVFVEYLENRTKMAEKQQDNNEAHSELHSQVKALQKRIENLETIASEAPGEFSGAGFHKSAGTETGLFDLREENRDQVEEMARKRKQKG